MFGRHWLDIVALDVIESMQKIYRWLQRFGMLPWTLNSYQYVLELFVKLPWNKYITGHLMVMELQTKMALQMLGEASPFKDAIV